MKAIWGFGYINKKPDKPLDAYDTWKEYYSDIDMEPTLKLLGFWRQK